ncbi:MAG: acyl-CoA mutase large subunit family protein [Synergistaceae bacterium]|jgi:methylmalonyl-CoA mutase|nr:acyl-CoA mutase large subunit family protein [Synergistaceae bacterium]
MEDEQCHASEVTASNFETLEADFGEFPETTYEQWKAAAVKALKDAPFEKSMYTRTYEGITLEPLYTREKGEALGVGYSLPGEALMLRGASAGGYLGESWEAAQDVTAESAAETASLLKHELEHGTTAITFRAGDDLAPGTPVSSIEDVKTIIGGLDVKKYPFHVYTGASGDAIKHFFNAAKELGVNPADMSGCIGSDPIGAYLEAGNLPKDFAALVDELADAIKSARVTGHLRTVLLRGAVYHEGGANSAQEVAYVMANAIELISALQERGVDIDDFANSVRFEFELGSNFFMEIAKLRAARVVWARMAEEFSSDGESKRANIFGRTSRFTKTVYDPYVNLLRNSTEAFSGVMGGLDGLTIGPFDEAIRPADEFSRRVARNASIMLREEFHLTRPIDPAGGSWYIESLTEELSAKIWEIIRDVQSKGGMLAAVKSGHIQKAVGETLQERFKKLSSRSDRAVGTNMYPNLGETRLAPAGTQYGKAKAPQNTEITPILPHRWTEQFEELRDRTESYKAEHGAGVGIFLANMGPLSQHKARADFITGFMEVAGFDVLKNDGFSITDECASAAAESGADIAVICSTDATYPELVPPLAGAIKAKAPSMKVFLAGAPAEEFKQSYIDAGVDDFISVRSNCLAVLTEIQKGKGMTI